MFTPTQTVSRESSPLDVCAITLSVKCEQVHRAKKKKKQHADHNAPPKRPSTSASSTWINEPMHQKEDTEKKLLTVCQHTIRRQSEPIRSVVRRQFSINDPSASVSSVASNCRYWELWGAQQQFVSVISTKKVVRCGFSCFASSSSIIAVVADTHIGKAHERSVRRQISCFFLANVILLFLRPPWTQWCCDWCALGRSSRAHFGWVCSSHVSCWLLSVDVFAAVISWSVLLYVVLSWVILLWPVKTLERRQVVSSRHAGTSGRRAMHARLIFWRSGANGMGANALEKKSTFCGVLKTCVRPW